MALGDFPAAPAHHLALDSELTCLPRPWTGSDTSACGAVGAPGAGGPPLRLQGPPIWGPTGSLSHRVTLSSRPPSHTDRLGTREADAGRKWPQTQAGRGGADARADVGLQGLCSVWSPGDGLATRPQTPDLHGVGSGCRCADQSSSAWTGGTDMAALEAILEEEGPRCWERQVSSWVCGLRRPQLSPGAGSRLWLGL